MSAKLSPEPLEMLTPEEVEAFARALERKAAHDPVGIYTIIDRIALRASEVATERERERAAKIAEDVAARWSTFHNVAPAAAAEVAKRIREQPSTEGGAARALPKRGQRLNDGGCRVEEDLE